MHVKHYTTTLLLNTSKLRMFIAYWMPCTSARPAGPRNPNRSLLSVRDSPLTWILSLSLFLSDSRSLSLSMPSSRSLLPTHRPFVYRLDGNDLGAVSACPSRRSAVYDLARRCIDRSRGTRCKLFRSARSTSIARVAAPKHLCSLGTRSWSRTKYVFLSRKRRACNCNIFLRSLLMRFINEILFLRFKAF